MSLPIYQRVAVTDTGDVIPGAEYTVINENTGVAAPIYSDRTGATLLTAPYFADSAGVIQFFIAQGTTFRVSASGGVGTYTDRYVYGVAEAVLVDASGNVVGDISLGDNDKLLLGTSSDLQIYHDGTNSIIADVGTGDLNISGGNDIRLQTPTGENGLILNQDGAIKLYYDGVAKLKTTATGIDVTGQVTADGLVVDGNVGAAINLFNTTGGGQALNFRPEFGDSNKYNMSISSYDHATGSGDSDGLSINGYDGVSICTGSSTSRLERVRIDNAGHVIAGGGLTLGNGQVYSADKTLDDYEEGNWTPTVTANAGTQPTIVYGARYGSYTKIGNLVTILGYFKLDSVSGVVSGIAQFGGLPFTIASNGSDYAVGNFTGNRLNFARPTCPGLNRFSNSSIGFLSTQLDDSAWGWETVSIFTSGDEMKFSMTYITDQ